MKKLAAIFSLILVALVAFANNEINTIITFKVTKGNLDFTRSVNLLFSLTNSNPNVAGATQIITNGPTAITMGSVATNGWAYFRNLGTNYVELGYWDTTNFFPVTRMNTNEPALMRLSPTWTPYAQGLGNNVIEKYIVDN